MKMTPLETEMLKALKHALFILESPALLPLTNDAGTVDFVRQTIAKVEISHEGGGPYYDFSKETI